MKKIITIFSAAMLLFAGTNAFAQMSIGAGFMHDVQAYKLAKNADPVNFGFNGFYAGVGYSAPLAGGLKFTPGLYYEFLNNSDSALGIETNITEHYISIPMDFSYGFDLTPNFRCSLYAGPTARMGLASTSKVTVGGTSTKDKNYGDNADYSRLDIMVGGGIAADIMNVVRFNIGYDYGLLNRYTGDTEGISQHNSRLTVGVAYLF